MMPNDGQYTDINAMRRARVSGSPVFRDDNEIVRWLQLRQDLASAPEGVFVRARSVATEWGMERNRVYRFLSGLAEIGCVRLETSPAGTLICLASGPNFITGMAAVDHVTPIAIVHEAPTQTECSIQIQAPPQPQPQPLLQPLLQVAKTKKQKTLDQPSLFGPDPEPVSPPVTAPAAAAPLAQAELPALASSKKPVSPLKLIFDQGVSILMTAGADESKARGCIGRLLRDYDEAYVAKAITELAKKPDILSPFPYMQALLKNYPKKDGTQTIRQAPVDGVPTPPVKHRPIATAEYLGLSAGMQQKIKAGSDACGWTVPLRTAA